MALNGVRVFCFDFDETITERHTHNFLRECGFKVGTPLTNDIMEICLKNGGFKHPELTLAAIQKIMNQGDLVAIASYNCYPDMIRYTLEKLGLSESELAKIKISTGFPTDEGNLDPTGRKRICRHYGKELHIADIIAWANEQGFSVSNEDVILIDDDPKNIEIARENGHKTIQVPKIDEPSDLDYLTIELSHYIGGYDPQFVEKCKADLAIDISNNALIQKLSNKHHDLDEQYEEQRNLMNMPTEVAMTEKDREQTVEKLIKIRNKRYLFSELSRLCSRQRLTQPTVPIQFDSILEQALQIKEVQPLLTEQRKEKIKRKVLGI